MQISIKFKLYSRTFIELVDSEIISSALVPDSSPVIFINADVAFLLMDMRESCIRMTSCFNISGSFSKSSRPSAVAVTPKSKNV